MLDLALARELFRYDALTGKLYWASQIDRRHFANDRAWKRFNTLLAGTETGTPDTGGYLQTRWKLKAYRTHRIIWLLHYGVWPSEHTDHEDHDRTNNRIKNLRDFSKPANNAHKKNNKSGHPCIFFQERNTNRPWMVQVYSGGRYLTQRSFKELNDAITHRNAVRAANGLPPV